jgi:hypothetical protein
LLYTGSHHSFSTPFLITELRKAGGERHGGTRIWFKASFGKRVKRDPITHYVQWFKPVTPAMWKAEVRRITV